MTPVVATSAARALHDDGVTAAVVNRWRARGWIVPVGVARSAGRGRPALVYDVDDLWAAYGRWKGSPEQVDNV